MSLISQLDGGLAISKIKESKHSRWSHSDESKNISENLAINRIHKNIFIPFFEPKFKLSRESKVFTIGSCFAREIEHALLRLGVDVSSAVFSDGSDSVDVSGFNIKKHPSELLNRYSVPSMYQEVMNLLTNGVFLGDNLIYKSTNGSSIETHYTNLLGEGLYEDILGFRNKITSVLSKRILSSDVIILTLGLNEYWMDKNTGLVLNTIPSMSFLKEHLKEINVCFGMPTDIVSILSEACFQMRSVMPNIKILLTVSPVPLEYTFFGGDIVMANQSAKSILYSAAIEMALRYDYIDYFPSYECVNFSDPSKAWKNDRRHVQRNAVDSIMEFAIESYF